MIAAAGRQTTARVRLPSPELETFLVRERLDTQGEHFFVNAFKGLTSWLGLRRLTYLMHALIAQSFGRSTCGLIPKSRSRQTVLTEAV